MRVDFNVPQDKATGAITNTQRIAAALPSIRFALEKGASVVLMSHLGRPDGKRNAKYSLKPVAAELEKLLGRPVTFLDDCVGPAVEAACAALKPGQVVLLENLRFHIEEEGKVKVKNGRHRDQAEGRPGQGSGVSRQSQPLGDVLRERCLRHRAPRARRWSAWRSGQGGRLPDGGRAEGFRQGARPPDRPLLAILGGAKIADKIPLINNLIEKADKIIIGGGMAYTFKKQLRAWKSARQPVRPEGAKIVQRARGQGEGQAAWS
jgi:phosphoglycerate kinase